ncbi:MAG: putative TonB-dependent siderophore receptor, partial [Sphingomonas bacterium]|uniref:TonB-dependent receptor n=1 Tax=Sphingomonas bacterium TaxID=1895847 RepID=UPI00263A1CC2
TQAPLATRTSGLGASARSLVYADGALLSALIGNNNTSASPRWSLVSPQEVERIDVLYGPFSAAYPGNSIGAVVNITTRLPDKLEGTISAGTNIQRFSQYGTSRTLPTYAFGATIGDRFGPLSIFASATRVTSNGQPLAYVTALRPATLNAGGSPTGGGFDDVNRAGAPIRVIGAGGFEHQQQGIYKLKAALDLTSAIRLTYVGGLFVNDTDATAETYLTGASGPAYSGDLNIAGHPYSIAASTFSNNVYRYDERHWSHSLSATGTSSRFDWQVIGTLYDFVRDEQRIPTVALPAALSGGAGTITRLDGTGWQTLDAKGVWRSDEAASHAISFGYHHDRFTLASNRYATADWIAGAPGALNLASSGKTQTDALWLQDAWHIAAPLTLTVGGRQEWWKAFDGANFSLAPTFSVSQPRRSASRFSPKASLAWRPARAWTATLSFGEAYRFPTVTELYQAITTGPTITAPNPTLKPERALSQELALQHNGDHGYVRLSLFNESITDALLSQSAPLVAGSTTLFTYVQNVDRVRTRGAEVVFEQRNVLPRFDLSGSLTLIDPRIRADAAFPAAIGKRPPQLLLRKANLVATWRPEPAVALTAAARYASRSFGTIDNSDPVSNTFQGFGSYVVVDLRTNVKVTPKWSMGLGIDNIGNRKYYLFHPFPQRSLSADLTYAF